MSRTVITREMLHARGFRPDGKGGLARLPAAEWTAKHGTTRPIPQIRIPRPRVPNKTEAAWLASATLRWPELTIVYELITFRLRSGACYTPDFTGWDKGTLVFAAEVKAQFIHNSRSILAWKTAAAEIPHVTWIFAQRRGGQWAETEIKALLATQQ